MWLGRVLEAGIASMEEKKRSDRPVWKCLFVYLLFVSMVFVAGGEEPKTTLDIVFFSFMQKFCIFQEIN